MADKIDNLTTCVGSASTLAELMALLREIDPMTLTSRDVARAVRAVDRVGIGVDVRVAFCGTHTFEPLPDYLRTHGLLFGLGVAPYVVPYGQYMQQLLADGSDLAGFDPHVVLVSCALRQIAPQLHFDFGSVSDQDIDAERNRIVDHLVQAAEAATARTSAIVLMANFPRPPHPSLGIADAKQTMGETEFFLALNLELLRRFKDSDRVHVFDLDRLIGGVRATSAERMFFMAKTLWHESHCNAIAQELMRFVVAGTGRTRKCLVVDLDNTLWSGVVGEEGPGGVAVGPGSALGEAFESHQHAIRALSRRGVMLAVCSKNNPADVSEVFAKRPDMPIKWSDFLAAEVSWSDKAAGLRRLAAELNIGEDSLVFIDDSPAERAIVRGELPTVIVPELPRDPADYATFLRQQVYFEKLRVKQDDLVRVHDYGAQRGRERLRADTRDLDKYLAGLKTKIVVRSANRSDLARVHELFNKTNQFNLTTRRYSVADVEGFIGDPKSRLGVVSASDRFGAMGTVGVYLMRHQGEEVLLDSLLLSCRALGRGIETATMNCVKLEAQEVFGCRRLIAEFIPTARNEPANGFLVRQGLGLVERRSDGTETFRAEGAGLEPRSCVHVSVDRELTSSRETA